MFKILGKIFTMLMMIAAITLMILAGLDFAGDFPDSSLNVSVAQLVIDEVLLFSLFQINLIGFYLIALKGKMKQLIKNRKK